MTRCPSCFARAEFLDAHVCPRAETPERSPRRQYVPTGNKPGPVPWLTEDEKREQVAERQRRFRQANREHYNARNRARRAERRAS